MTTSDDALPEPVARAMAQMRNSTNQTWIAKRLAWADIFEAAIAREVAR